MRHRWDEGETFMDEIISFCTVCGGVRVRERREGLDYINFDSFHLDMVGRTRRGWHYDGTPRSCPGPELVEKQEPNGTAAGGGTP